MKSTMHSTRRDSDVKYPCLLRIGNRTAHGVAPDAAVGDRLRDEYDIEFVETLSDGLDRLDRIRVAAILVEPDLPDSPGLDALAPLLRRTPEIPIVVLGRASDEDLFDQALALGAQDFLLAPPADALELTRIVHASIARKRAQQLLNEEKERACTTLESIGDGILSTDTRGRVTYLNIVAERLTGWTSQEAFGRPAIEVFRVVDGQTRQPGRDVMDHAVRANETVGLSADSVLIRRDGSEVAIEDSISPIHDRIGRTTGAVAVFRDVGAARAMASRMSHFAQHDFLTELPNRLLFGDRVEQSIAVAHRHGHLFAILFVDIDHLKHVNDSLGHGVGDLLLKAVASRLVASVRASDTICRQGGDEFVILLSEIERESDAALTADKIRNALTMPCIVAEHELVISASIGISVYPRDGRDVETLMTRADTAMYEAKASGRNTCRFFSDVAPGRSMTRDLPEESPPPAA